MKENPERKKANSDLQHLRLSTDFRILMGEERLNAFLFLCIHRDTFLDCDKTIEIYTSKYPKWMLLTNPLSEN